MTIADKARRAAEWLKPKGYDNKLTKEGNWQVCRVLMMEDVALIRFAEDRGWQDTEPGNAVDGVEWHFFSTCHSSYPSFLSAASTFSDQ